MLRAGGSIVVALCAFVLAPAALAGGPSMLVGAVEEAPKATDMGQAKAKMDLAKLAGYDSIRVTQMWTRTATAPAAAEIQALRNVANAAALDGMRAVVAIHPQDSSATPTTPEWRAQFAAYAAAVAQNVPGMTDFIIGNEPNINMYWLPQFAPDGSDQAAADYEDTLARTYDAIKAVRPDARIMGGALSPRGADVPGGSRPTHSPTQFIRDLGAVYRASGRTSPIMDVLVLHPYGESSATPPSFDHQATTPVSIADYPKVVSLLAEAFDGTAQAGSTLPILYGEYGVSTAIPPAKAGLYTGTPLTGNAAVSESTQAAQYREAMKLAYCQANTIGLLIFHVTDESAYGWQSGPYYADDTAKTSLDSIRTSMNEVRAGTITGCPDQTAPTATLAGPADGSVVHGSVTLTATAADDVGVGRVEFLANGNVITYKSVPPTYAYSWPTAGLASGTYALQVRALDGIRNAGLSNTITITVDNTPPETTITSAPTDSAQAATFQFGASEGGATFECALDGAAFAACTSPVFYTALAAGQHTFQVRSADGFGNADQTPASFTWTVVDTTKPESAIDSGPSGTVASASATFAFSASEPSTFECSLDGGAFAACTSPATYSGLASSQHTLQVRAIDTAGNVDDTPASRTWTVDTLAPDTTIVSGPTGSVTSASATFTFTSSETGTFECALDAGAFAACTSPKSYSGLATGSHTFQVRARDAVGNLDATPASRTWTVTAATPANDMFAAAQKLAGSSGRATGSNKGATLEAGEPRHAGVPNGASVWYAWTAPASVTVTVDTATSGFDTVLAVYRGSAVNGLTAVASNDDVSSSNVTSRVSFWATAGTTYRIAVAGYGAATGSVTLNWR